MTDYDEYKFEIAEQQEQIDKHFQTRYINLFNMIENFKKRWVGFDELWTRCFSSHNPYDRDLFVSNNENFVDYLEHCVNSLSTGSSSKWKWAAISFHGALYCAIVEAISIEWGQQQTITRRNQIKGYGKLVDFLLKKYSDDVGTYNLPELFDDDPYEQNIERIILQKALPSIRNSFAHFNLEPFLWHTNGLAHMFLIALLPLTRLVVHWNIEVAPIGWTVWRRF